MSVKNKKEANFFRKMVADYDDANLDHREKLAACVTSIAYFSDQLRAIALNGEAFAADAAKQGYIIWMYEEYKESLKDGIKMQIIIDSKLEEG